MRSHHKPIFVINYAPFIPNKLTTFHIWNHLTYSQLITNINSFYPVLFTYCKIWLKANITNWIRRRYKPLKTNTKNDIEWYDIKENNCRMNYVYKWERHESWWQRFAQSVMNQLTNDAWNQQQTKSPIRNYWSEEQLRMIPDTGPGIEYRNLVLRSKAMILGAIGLGDEITREGNAIGWTKGNGAAQWAI